MLTAQLRGAAHLAALLAAHGLKVGDALLITIVCRLVTLWLAESIGWGAIIAWRHRLVPAAVSSWP